VDLLAPAAAMCTASSGFPAYRSKEGTSFAAPFVSALVNIVLAEEASANASYIVGEIRAMFFAD
jgi:hypothetical protein